MSGRGNNGKSKNDTGLTASTIEALKEFGDVNKFMKQTEETEIKRKVAELVTYFPGFPISELESILKKNNGNVDNAVVAVVTLVEDKKKKEARDMKKKREEEEKNKRERALELASKELIEAFKAIPKERIQEVLEMNEGNVEEATMQLLAETRSLEDKKREEERNKKEAEKKRREEEERKHTEIKLAVLRDKFPNLKDEVLMNVLKSSGNDLKKSAITLVAMVENDKRQELQRLFPMFTAEEVEDCLTRAKRDKVEAVKILTERKFEREAEMKKHEAKEKIVVNQGATNRIEDDLLHHSIIIADEMNNQAQCEIIKEKAEFDKIFFANLQNIIDAQVRGGSAPPLTIKEIQERVKSQPAPPVPTTIEPNTHPLLPAPSQSSEIQSNNNNGFKVNLVVSPPQIDLGGKVTATWEVEQGTSTSSDWIGLYPVLADNKQYITYEWRGKEEKKGSVTFSAPAHGEYECRYIHNRNYANATFSNRFKVGPVIQMETKLSDTKQHVNLKWNLISGNTYSNAWVGLYLVSEKNNKNYLSWQHAKSTDLTFDAPIKPNAYEFRFFANSYTAVAHSAPFYVEGNDKISVVPSAVGGISVLLDLVTVDPHSDTPWVGVYHAEEPSNRNFIKYKKINERKDKIPFSSNRLTVGKKYEVRVLAFGTYDAVVLKSQPFIFTGEKTLM